jgi:hypothetical protein
MSYERHQEAVMRTSVARLWVRIPAVLALLLFALPLSAEASSNSFVGFLRLPINKPNFVSMQNNQAYFRDAFVAGQTAISGATDGETWSATVTPFGGTPLPFGTITFFGSLNGQSNCFVSLGWPQPLCGSTAINIIWFIQSQCQPTGPWTWSFTNNGVEFARPTFTLLGEIPDLPTPINQNSFAGKTYDTICFKVVTDPDGKQHKVKAACGTEGAIAYDIKQKGCVLVDAVMVLQYHGVTTDVEGNPVTVEGLNAWLTKTKDGYNKAGGVNLHKLYDYSGKKVKVREVSYSADDRRLRNALCGFGPTITPVISPSTQEAGGHSVVTTGRDDPVSPTTWKILDPDGGLATTLKDKTVYANKYFGMRVIAGPQREFIHNGRVIAQLFSPAEVLVTDPLGRRTGFDPLTNATFNEIPLAGYGRQALEDLESDTGDEWREFDVVEPGDGAYEFTVTGTATGVYDLQFITVDRDGADQASLNFDQVPTAPGVVHRYVVQYSATPGATPTLTGGFDGHGQRPADVNKLLTYANPTSARTHLPPGDRTAALVVFYGSAILPPTFRATLNGVDVTSRFSPVPDGHETVSLSLVAGSNVLVLSVDGTVGSGRVATDTDRLVFLAQ